MLKKISSLLQLRGRKKNLFGFILAIAAMTSTAWYAIHTTKSVLMIYLDKTYLLEEVQVEQDLLVEQNRLLKEQTQRILERYNGESDMDNITPHPCDEG
jgi:hypothetical protein